MENNENFVTENATVGEPKYLRSFVCAFCSHPTWEVVPESEMHKASICPCCGKSQACAEIKIEQNNRLKFNEPDVVEAFKACQRMMGLETAIGVMLEWIMSSVRVQLAFDLWDTAALGTGGIPNLRASKFLDDYRTPIEAAAKVEVK